MWTELGLQKTILDAVGQDRSGSDTVEILSLIATVSDGLPMAELILVAASSYLWWQRHQHVKAETIQSADKAAISIRVLATNFLRAYSNKQPERKRDHMWKRPTGDMVKVNVDVAFQAKTLS